MIQLKLWMRSILLAVTLLVFWTPHVQSQRVSGVTDEELEKERTLFARNLERLSKVPASDSNKLNPLTLANVCKNVVECQLEGGNKVCNRSIGPCPICIIGGRKKKFECSSADPETGLCLQANSLNRCGFSIGAATPVINRQSSNAPPSPSPNVGDSNGGSGDGGIGDGGSGGDTGSSGETGSSGSTSRDKKKKDEAWGGLSTIEWVLIIAGGTVLLALLGLCLVAGRRRGEKAKLARQMSQMTTPQQPRYSDFDEANDFESPSEFISTSESFGGDDSFLVSTAKASASATGAAAAATKNNTQRNFDSFYDVENDNDSSYLGESKVHLSVATGITSSSMVGNYNSHLGSNAKGMGQGQAYPTLAKGAAASGAAAFASSSFGGRDASNYNFNENSFANSDVVSDMRSTYRSSGDSSSFSHEGRETDFTTFASERDTNYSEYNHEF